MLNLFTNEIRLQFFLLKRYWFETVASSVLLIGLFLGLYFIISAMNDGTSDASDLETLIIGFVIWVFANASYSSASKDIVEEIRQNTLERLSLSPSPLWMIFLLRAIWNIISGLAFLIFALTALSYITNIQLQIDWTVFLPSLLLGMPSLIGLGFVIAGFSVLFKKAQSIQGVIYFVLIGVISVTALPLNPASILPFATAATTAKSSISGGLLDLNTVIFISLNSILYFFLGLIIFKKLLNKSRHEGVLGHY
ncbi:hypothetical protein H4J50_16405 [Colwellia sp. 6M3]|uniref:hypothetical protein n=1 Tax=Colwellia sp. 6M3 TaxID=2759849 RepID=UPI0015F4936A|nr:hypothetical protein [Colwellia sp. 6M3]MBA6417592.1 hypothetical protein [Colwellia sp. 6M3]|tara:strand:- start:17577 stop:18332 length:756 start_codon:yes stop_codon:yes gene_type:complete